MLQRFASLNQNPVHGFPFRSDFPQRRSDSGRLMGNDPKISSENDDDFLHQIFGTDVGIVIMFAQP